jgi:integrase/recombinase XerD
MRDKALFTLLLDSGIRTTEAATLLQRNIFTETVMVDGKCGEHEVPITEETRRLLMALIAQDGPHKYVFHNPQGGPLSRHTIYKLVRYHMKKVGIDGPKMGGHRLRHTFGRYYLSTGGDTRSLQEILGHADITTTEKYSSLNMRDIIKKHHQHTPLKLVHGAAQGVLIADELIREVEAILTKQPETGGANKEKQIRFF